MLKIYRTKKWFPTVSHESDTRNRKLVSEIFWNLQACIHASHCYNPFQFSPKTAILLIIIIIIIKILLSGSYSVSV